MAPSKRVIRLVSVIFVLTASMPCESKFSNDTSPPCTKPSEFYKVLLSNDGPTTFGGLTTFYARVIEKRHFQKPSRTHYRFCWDFPDSKEICNNRLSNEDKFHWDKWKSSGMKSVKVTVYFDYEESTLGAAVVVVCMTNTTTVTVTDTINAKLKASQGLHSAIQGVQLHVGQVKLNVVVHDPSHFFEKNISCWWYFGDGNWLNSTTMKQVFHNFTEDKEYYLSVNMSGWRKGTLGRRMYSGYTRLTLDLSANLAPKLVIYGRPGPKLPNPRKDRINVVLAVGVARFVVKFTDPYHLVQRVRTEWEFHLDGEKSDILFSNDSITYNFTSPSNYTLWATSTLYTQNNKYPLVEPKNLLIQEPIKDLNLQHSQQSEKRTVFNVSCQGSGPFSFCWLIAKNYCPLPVDKACSLTLERKACRIVINHTFENPGDYCINLTAENEVSSAHTYVKVKISNDDTPTAASRTESVSIVLPIFLCIIAVIVLAILLRKWMSYKKHPVERADFDFRDEDCRSISSVDLHMGQRCFPCKAFGRCSKGEGDYLLSSIGTVKYKSSGMYTELL